MLYEADEGDLKMYSGINKFNNQIIEDVYPNCILSKNNQIIVGVHQNKFKVWSLNGKKEFFSKEIWGRVCSAILNKNGSFLVTGGGFWLVRGIPIFDSKIRVYDLRKKKMIKKIESHSSSIISLQYNTDYTRLISGSRDSCVKIWDTKNWKVLKTIRYDSKLVDAKISYNNNYIISKHDDNTCKVYDLQKNRLVANIINYGGKGWVAFSNNKIFYADEKGVNNIKVKINGDKYLLKDCKGLIKEDLLLQKVLNIKK